MPTIELPESDDPEIIQMEIDIIKEVRKYNKESLTVFTVCMIIFVIIMVTLGLFLAVGMLAGNIYAISQAL